MAEWIQTLAEWKQLRSNCSDELGFVPTMGALHEGHRALLRQSRRDNAVSVMSIFVNPAQFNDPKDLQNYPRTLDKDKEMAEEEGVDYIFLPSAEEMYPDKYHYRIGESEISKKMEGKYRPGHFDGVLTVVMKLFQIIRPQRAYFGEKDYQQYLLIKGMVKAFFMDIEIVGLPIVREDSGLAMSSRNQLLSDDGRSRAAGLHWTLSDVKDLAASKRELEAQGFDIDYVEEAYGRRFAAVQVDGVRLIDNVAV